MFIKLGAERILVVEDNDDHFRLICTELRAHQLTAPSHGDPQRDRSALDTTSTQIDRASSLTQALKVLQQNLYDLILLDCSLPDAEGLRGLEQIRQAHQNIPIIVITAANDESMAVRALQSGAQDYLVKGERGGSLRRTIRYAMERHVIQLELAEARQEALFSNESKSRFLATMSHELRTPLTVIIGFSEQLLDHQIPPDLQRAVAAINRNAEHLHQLVNDILDISRIEAGKLELHLEDCSIFELLNDLEQTFRPRAAARGLEFAISYQFPLPARLLTDSGRVRQILYNLVANALKFTPRGGISIEVCVKDQPSATSDQPATLTVAVKDTGIGIAEEELGRIFGRFNQVDSPISRAEQGSGLGLRICLQLAAMLRGRIEVESRINEGSRFSLSLPVTDAPLLQDVPPESTVRPQQNPVAESVHGNVLVGDDAPDTRELLRCFLAELGITADFASNGQEVLERVGMKQYDLILLDMQMPVLNGYETVRALRRTGCTAKIVAVTATAMNDALIACLEAGCDEYLRKPFRKHELFALIRHHLGAPAVAVQVAEKCDCLEDLLLEGPGLAGAVLSFLDELPQSTDALREARGKLDRNSLYASAHRLAVAELFGFKELGDLASAVQRESKSADLDQLDPLLKTLYTAADFAESQRPRVMARLSRYET